MISLLFKFFGDRTPLKQEAEKAKGDMRKAGSDIGKEFGSQMKGAIMGAVGVGAIVSALKKGVDDIAKSANTAASSAGGLGIRETLALDRASAATGLSKDEILQQAKASPDKFKDFISQYETPISESGLQNISRAEDRAKGLASKLVDAVLFSMADQFNKTWGVLKFAAGGSIGDVRMAEGGAIEALTGVSRDVLGKTPKEEFLNAVGSSRNLTESLQKLLEATEKGSAEIKQAIERN